VRRAIGSPTRVQQQYHDAARELGCIICLFRIRRGMQHAIGCGVTHIHHRNLGDLHGQKQLGHDSIVVLGAWHHDGVVLPNRTIAQMRDEFGPSYAHHAKDFRAWTADVLPGYGRGTEAWQRLMDEELAKLRGGIAA
jgi:hypothetical protein